MARLARNLDDLRRLVRELTAKGVRVQFVEEQLTFTGDDTAMVQPVAVGHGAPSRSSRGRSTLAGEFGSAGRRCTCTDAALLDRARRSDPATAGRISRRSASLFSTPFDGPRVEAPRADSSSWPLPI